MYIIMGGGDERLSEGWVSKLKDTPAQIYLIEGANHFMDGSNEFDLLEVVIDKLDS